MNGKQKGHAHLGIPFDNDGNMELVYEQMLSVIVVNLIYNEHRHCSCKASCSTCSEEVQTRDGRAGNQIQDGRDKVDCIK